MALALLALALPGCNKAAPPAGPSSARARRASRAADEPPLYVPPPPQQAPFVLDMAPGVRMEFQWIPPGSFMMGDLREGIARHKVTFERPFYLAKYEVTQQQWAVLMPDNPSAIKRPDYPVHRVHREDCEAFVKAMNEKYAASGMTFALPTEAQWEYACRAGHAVRVDTPDDPSRIEQYAWLGSNSGYEPHPVGQKKPNDWGLHDMQGNVAEWCADELFARGHLPGLPPEALNESPDEPWYVVRGGNYRDGASACTSSARVLRRGFVPLRHDGLRLLSTPK